MILNLIQHKTSLDQMSEEGVDIVYDPKKKIINNCRFCDWLY